jgi:hypothetical protein
MKLKGKKDARRVATCKVSTLVPGMQSPTESGICHESKDDHSQSDSHDTTSSRFGVWSIDAVGIRLLQITNNHVETYKREQREFKHVYVQEQESLVSNPLRKCGRVCHKVERRYHVMQEHVATSEQSATCTGDDRVGETRTE